MCESPCASSSECRVGVCENEICMERVAVPLPQNCCRNNDDCSAEVDGNPCFLAECNLSSNSCEFTQLCSASVYENPIYCEDETECNDFNSCTAERCIQHRCVTGKNPSINDPNCCQFDRDCPEYDCKRAFCSTSFRCGYSSIPGCVISNGLSKLYDEEESGTSEKSSSEDSSEEEEDESPGAGDVIGAVIGFVILGALVISFIVVVLLMAVQKVLRRITSE